MRAYFGGIMKNAVATILLLLSFCPFSKSIAFAKEYSLDGVRVNVEKIFEGESVIWGMDFISHDELLFTERDGKLKLLNLKNLKYSDVSGAPKVYAQEQGGLLDLFYDQSDKSIYMTYADPEAPLPTTSLFKGKLSPDKKGLVGARFFQAKAFNKGGIHFGSRVLVDSKGFIFMSIGERNNRDQSQRLDNHQGKILRLTKSGIAPADNPFVGTKGALPEIWSYGHRNPQGLAMSKEGRLWNAEFGPRGGDEVNLVEAGANYGWPVITYGREYYGLKIGTTSKEGMKQPARYWVPSINPSGITFYNGSVFNSLSGNLLMASLTGHIRRLVIKNNTVIKDDIVLDELNERIRNIKVGPDSFIYLSTDSGKIFKISPKLP